MISPAHNAKADQLYAYVQERCLWQFFSRTWDRQENIDGIVDTAAALLTGKQPPRHTPAEKLFYADAVIMVADFRQRFPWLETENPSHIHEILGVLKQKLVDIAITSSKNHELSHSLY
jgi:nitrogenase delta subunit